MRDCGSRLFRQKLELMDYNFKILYRPGAQNYVADALSRIRPLSIEEMLEMEEKKQHFAITRNQAKMKLDASNGSILDERNGTILRKAEFDLIFHLIPENNIFNRK